MVHMAKPWHVEHAEYIPEQQKKDQGIGLIFGGRGEMRQYGKNYRKKYNQKQVAIFVGWQ